MHKTKWEMYHIPKNNKENVEKIKKEENKDKDKNKIKFSQLVNAIEEDNNNISEKIREQNKKEEYNDNILYIPPHDDLSKAITKSFDINNALKLNLTQEDIEAMTKIGILTHSFDANFIPQINYQDNTSGEENYIEIKSNNKKGIKKVSSQGSMGTTLAGSQKIFYNDN